MIPLCHNLHQRRRCCSVASCSYRTLRGALSYIVRHEGLGALYSGLGPSLTAILPEAAITYGLHDLLKKGYRQVRRAAALVAVLVALQILLPMF